MISPDQVSIEVHKNIINTVLKDIEKNRNFESFYFLLKTDEKINNAKDIYSLSKINFRDELIVDTEKKEENNEKDEKGKDEEKRINENSFSLFFNDLKTEEKKKKKNLKESSLIQKLKDSNISISDEEMLHKIRILLNCKIGGLQKEGENMNIKCLKNCYSFYDEVFSSNFYLKQEENLVCDFYISKQLNNLTVVSLGKYSNILIEMIHYIKGLTKYQNIKEAIKENVKIQYDERLLKANTSGKRKKNTICINYNMSILQISFNNKIYKIKSIVQGLLCDLNEQLVNDPSLLLSDTQQEGWIIILKNVNNKVFDSTLINTVQQYEEENKHQEEILINFVSQFD